MLVELGNAVFHDDAGDSGASKEVAHFGTFDVDGQPAIATTGKVNDGCAIWLRGSIYRESWVGDIGDAMDGATLVVEVRTVKGRLRIFCRRSTRCAVGPKLQGDWLLRVREEGG